MPDNSKYAPASAPGIAIRSANDISDVLMASLQNSGLILTESELCPEFFDLSTGLAGEALQKFVNYQARVAIVVPDRDSHGDRFRELMHEHRRHPLVRFYTSVEEAAAWLGGNPRKPG